MELQLQLQSYGYLEVVLGPMFSGKTSKLVDIYKKNKYCNIPVLSINHESDNRYSETMISTHDKVMIPGINCNRLFDIDLSKIEEYDIFLINEGQFFDDLYDFVVHLLDKKKKIYVFGLDGDFEKKKFGQILDLIPLCDKVEKLQSLCAICKNGRAGIFSKRISTETNQVLVGSDNYVPACRDCH